MARMTETSRAFGHRVKFGRFLLRYRLSADMALDVRGVVTLALSFS